MITKNQINSAIFGCVIGDAVGVPYEFKTKEQMKENPCEDMVGYGTYQQPSGTWSDDSSMTLATLASLAKNGVNYDDLMNRFNAWLHYGTYTPYGEVFDYGNTTYKAVMRYPNTSALKCGLTDERSNGNGSLMRIMPVCLYVNKEPIDDQIDIINKYSQTTHGHKISKASCNIYNFIVQEILNNPKKKLKTSINDGLKKSEEFYNNDDYKCFNKIYSDLFDEKLENIFSKGYVVDSLEVALYCAYHTTSYKESILTSVNTGGDTDTNACICGGLTGLYYGYGKIPKNWKDGLRKDDYIQEFCDEFYESLGGD